MHPEPASAVSPPGGEAVAEHPARELTRREHDMLAFERQWWRHAGAKETAIREQFGVPPTRYYQVLNALVDRPAALAADPMLVRRLRRLRTARRARRSPSLLGKGSPAI